MDPGHTELSCIRKIFSPLASRHRSNFLEAMIKSTQLFHLQPDPAKEASVEVDNFCQIGCRLSGVS